MPSRLTTSSAAATASALVQSSAVVAGASRAAVAAPAARLSVGRAGFSTTSSLERNTLTRRMFLEWSKKGGKIYRRHMEDGPAYVALGRIPRQQSRHPFPINPLFRTTPVLDDRGRELVWSKVMRDGESIKAVSAELGVDITRVAAVVRLKEVEKDWVAKGKKLATPYQKAILSMLPTRNFRVGIENRPLEDVNELYNHPATQKQLFWPTSEARQFTREDAAKAFHAKMLSADKRVPIPELIQMEKDLAGGKSPVEARARFIESAQNSERIAAEKVMRRAMAEEEASTKVNTPRFEFRFQNYNSELVGRDGRSPNAVGWKYGMPHYDRKKGLAKIPTSAP